MTDVLTAEPSCCASCGTAGGGTITLKRCCGATFYCNSACQKAHRKSHKKECLNTTKKAKGSAAPPSCAADGIGAAKANEISDGNAEHNLSEEHMAMCNVWGDVCRYLEIADLAQSAKVAKFLRGKAMIQNKLVADELEVGIWKEIVNNRKEYKEEHCHFSTSFLGSFYLPKIRKLTIDFNDVNAGRAYDFETDNVLLGAESAEALKPFDRYDSATDVLCWLAAHCSKFTSLEELDIEAHHLVFLDDPNGNAALEFMTMRSARDEVRRLQKGMRTLKKNLSALPNLKYLRINLLLTDVYDGMGRYCRGLTSAISELIRSDRLAQLSIDILADPIFYNGGYSKEDSCLLDLAKAIVSTTRLESLRLLASDNFYAIMNKMVELVDVAEGQSFRLRSINLNECAKGSMLSSRNDDDHDGVPLSQIFERFQNSPGFEELSLGIEGFKTLKDCTSLQRFLSDNPKLRKVDLSLINCNRQDGLDEFLASLLTKRVFSHFRVNGLDISKSTAQQLHGYLISESIPHAIYPEYSSLRWKKRSCIELYPEKYTIESCTEISNRGKDDICYYFSGTKEEN